MRSGQGRLSSLFLRRDLRRMYKFSKKFGVYFPLVYNAIVCPECLFASLVEDFEKPELYIPDELKSKENINLRKEQAKIFLPDINANFTKPRDLKHGMLSFYLSANCYNYCKASGYGEGKKGISLIRGAWCASDLNDQYKDEGYDEISVQFRFRAWKCYTNALKEAYKTKSKFAEIQNYGPDLDTNYGFNGFIYVQAYLTFLFLNTYSSNVEKYKKTMGIQNSLSKVFGFGKSSKNKPTPLLDTARDLYEEARARINKLKTDPDVIKALEESGS